MRWEQLGRRRPVDIVSTSPVQFTTFDIFAVFATTKALGRWVNQLLRSNLGRQVWAELCVDDYVAVSNKAPRSDAWARSLLGHAAMHFGRLALTEDDLLDAAAS
jgi:hypothetical protein